MMDGPLLSQPVEPTTAPPAAPAAFSPRDPTGRAQHKRRRGLPLLIPRALHPSGTAQEALHDLRQEHHRVGGHGRAPGADGAGPHDSVEQDERQAVTGNTDEVRAVPAGHGRHATSGARDSYYSYGVGINAPRGAGIRRPMP